MKPDRPVDSYSLTVYSVCVGVFVFSITLLISVCSLVYCSCVSLNIRVQTNED